MLLLCMLLDFFILLNVSFVHSLDSDANLETITDEIATLDGPITTTWQPTTARDSASSISMEILRLYVLVEFGNAVKLVWGEAPRDYNLNFTYGVHYGITEDDLIAPRLTTKNLSSVIKELEFCTKYQFAVTIIDDSNKPLNPNTIRSIITDMDQLAPPEDLQVEFEPGEYPGLLIKWMASCSNVVEPIGYLVSTFEKPTSRYIIVTLPKTKRVELIYHLKVNYGATFDIKVSTNFPGSQTTETVSYKVPSFLQPYKVKVTSNPDGAFMIYWREPYVPRYINSYYYEVHIYPGTNISETFDRLYVTRPVLIYKGNQSVYTFNVGFVSLDRVYKSRFTNPIVANLNGDTREIVLED